MTPTIYVQLCCDSNFYSTKNIMIIAMNLLHIILHQHLPRQDYFTILLVMALKDNVEILALMDLRVLQDLEEMLGLQVYLELKDQWVIEV